MRSLFIGWLITLLSLTNLSSVRFTTSQQGESPITFEAYWEFVANTRHTVIQLEMQPKQTIRSRLDELASQWEKIESVELPDQSVSMIDPSFLIAELRNEPPNLENLK